MKTTTVNTNDFSRWFRSKVRDPLAKATGLTDPQKFFVDSTLSSEMFRLITRIETREPNLTGTAKMNKVSNELKKLLIAQGLKELMPVVKLWAEQAVMFIYKKYFVERFKALGLNDWLEAFLEVDLDGDGTVAGKEKTVAETKKVTTTVEKKAPLFEDTPS